MSDIKNRIEQERVETAITDELIETLAVVTLVQGVLEDGQPHYAFVRIPQERYRDFKRTEASGSYALQDFGEILYHGEGLMPPEEVVVDMRRRYGADMAFEEQLLQMAQAVTQNMNQNETPCESQNETSLHKNE